jgi:large subunit ribosomal protein L10
MDRAEKVQVVEDFRNKLKAVAGVFIADYRGLTVEEVNKLRKAFRAVGAEYKVVKNTLLRRAIEGTGLDVIKGHLKGTTAIAIAPKDAVPAAKAAVDFAKAHEKFKLRGAFVEGQALAEAGIKALSTLPSQGEMRAQLLGVINAPAAKLLAQINAAGQQLAGVLQAKVDKDEGK